VSCSAYHNILNVTILTALHVYVNHRVLHYANQSTSHLIKLSQATIQRNFDKYCEKHSDAKDVYPLQCICVTCVADGTHQTTHLPLMYKHLSNCGTNAYKLAQKKSMLSIWSLQVTLTSASSCLPVRCFLRGSKW